MNSQDKLTHTEIMHGLSKCFRDLMTTDIKDENIPNVINRAKAAAAIVTAQHREEIFEAKRQQAVEITGEIREKNKMIAIG